MAAMDEFRKEREAIKNGTFKEKFKYFWYYYKVHTIVAVVVIIFLSNWIYELITATDPVLSVNFLNIYNMNDDYTAGMLLDEFIEDQKIDTKEYHIDSRTNLYYMTEAELAQSASQATGNKGSSNYNTMQLMMAQTGAEMLDALIGSHAVLNELAYQEYFADLSVALTPEEYALYEPYFLYMDRAVIEARHEAYDNNEPVTSIPIPLSNSAEDLEDPIPVFIDLSQCEKLKEVYGENTENLAIALIANAKNKEMAMKFVDFLMQK